MMTSGRSRFIWDWEFEFWLGFWLLSERTLLGLPAPLRLLVASPCVLHDGLGR